MIPVEFGGYAFSGPGGWADLTPKRYRYWVRWQRTGAQHVGLYALLKLWFRMKTKHLQLLDDDQRATLVDTVFGFLSERPSHWLQPRIRIGWRRYQGPGDRLQYLTFGEFMFAESARQSFSEEPTPEQTAELAAAIYRPYDSKREGGRSAFDGVTYDQQIRRFGRLPIDVLHGILINYYGCHDQLVTRFEHLYSKRKVESSDGSGSSTGWLDVGLNLARQTGALGSFHELERTNVYLVLTVLDNVMKEQAELDEKMRSND
jgi:hypothetical protein